CRLPVFRPQSTVKPSPRFKRKKIFKCYRSEKKLKHDDTDGSDKVSNIRRSFRLKGKPATNFGNLDESTADDDEYKVSDSDNDEERRVRKVQKPSIVVPKGRKNIVGAVPGIPVGKCWAMRIQCSFDGVHRPVVAGIHGDQDGCYSIALSGGYEDDLDYGECFTYTGSGGRDLRGTKNKPKNLRTAPQSKNQTLDGSNLSLSINVETHQPVRVIRGFKLKSSYAPAEGYRYDGLYYVEKYWYTTGLSGFGVYKFALKRCENQAPPLWNYETSNDLGELREPAENLKQELESSENHILEQRNGTTSETSSDCSPCKKDRVKTDENNNVEVVSKLVKTCFLSQDDNTSQLQNGTDHLHTL
ncbi:Uncharacterised protein at_DN0688, partial [Pycnogonum litorale]